MKELLYDRVDAEIFYAVAVSEDLPMGDVVMPEPKLNKHIIERL